MDSYIEVASREQEMHVVLRTQHGAHTSSFFEKIPRIYWVLKRQIKHVSKPQELRLR